MATFERLKMMFHSEINRLWSKWICEGGEIRRKEAARGYHQLCHDWASGYSTRKWLDRGPTYDDLFGTDARRFRSFCEHIGLDYEALISEPLSDRREVFKRRLSDKLAQYKKSTGRSMRALADRLGWSDYDYQWLRRIKANGTDHVRAKKERLRQLAEELDTTVDYLFGKSDVVDAPTWSAVIALGIAEYARQQPTESKFACPYEVSKYLESAVFWHRRYVGGPFWVPDETPRTLK